MSDKDNMSPNSSPGALGNSGVRRVNNWPLILVCGGLLIFVVIIAMVAVGRSAPQTQASNAPQPARAVNSSAMAADIVGGRDGGIIPPDAPPVAQVTEPATVPALPVARAENPDLPPVPRGGGERSMPEDPDAARIKMAKLQQFEQAVKAKTAISVPNEFASPDNSSSDTRTDTSSELEKVRRQIAAATTSQDPTTAYKAKLAQLQGMGGGDSSSQGDLESLQQGKANRNDITQYAGDGQSDRWALNAEVQKPKTPYEILSGAVIPGVMISGINSELPGQLIAQVSQNVYDTATGRHLLIPQATKIVGTYSSDIAYGQGALMVAWQRLEFPDGKRIDIGAMPGADTAGYSGFRDQVDNHYPRIFMSAFLLSGVTAGVTYSQGQNQSNNNSAPTAGSAMSEALGQQFGQVTAQLIAKNINIAPTLKIRPGYPFNIIVTKDMAFKTPYKSFDY